MCFDLCLIKFVWTDLNDDLNVEKYLDEIRRQAGTTEWNNRLEFSDRERIFSVWKKSEN